jgi:hypothetical protein
MLSVISPEELTPPDHSIRKIKPLAEAAPRELEPTFATMHAQIGYPSISPESLLRALR